MATPFVHNFSLEIGTVFGLPVYWYGAIYTVVFLGVLGWFALRRGRLGWTMADVVELSVLMALGIMIGGRAFDILVYELGDHREHPLESVNWWAGGHGLAWRDARRRGWRLPLLSIAPEAIPGGGGRADRSGGIPDGHRADRQLHRGG